MVLSESNKKSENNVFTLKQQDQVKNSLYKNSQKGKKRSVSDHGTSPKKRRKTNNLTRYETKQQHYLVINTTINRYYIDAANIYKL